jgi:hypothetical protein
MTLHYLPVVKIIGANGIFRHPIHPLQQRKLTSDEELVKNWLANEPRPRDHCLLRQHRQRDL